MSRALWCCTAQLAGRITIITVIRAYYKGMLIIIIIIINITIIITINTTIIWWTTLRSEI